MRWHRRLRKELRMVGASEAEATELTSLAQSLRTLAQDTQRTVKREPLLRKWAMPAAYVCSGLIVGVLLVGLSQAAPPTSALYPIQKATDNVAVLIDPSYQASVMMKRAAQVHELVLTHAGQGQIMAVLSSYTTVAQKYMASSPRNYAAFEYCEVNLKAAAVQSTPPVRQAIMESLRSLKSA